MAQFSIFTDKRNSNRNDPTNTKTALRIREDEEINQTALELQTEYYNSISRIQNTAEDDDKVRQAFYDLSGISLPSVVHDYIPETDDKYLNPLVQKRLLQMEKNNLAVNKSPNKRPEAKGFSGNIITGDLVDDNRRVYGMNHLEERVLRNQKIINDWFEANPGERGNPINGFFDYNYYKNERKKNLQYLEKEQEIGQRFNDGDNIIPHGTFATLYGVAQDPALWSTLPLSFMTGGTSLSLNGIVKMALWEGVIAAATETGIQFNAVDYNKHLDGNYGWEEARNTIAIAGVGGTLGAAGIAGLFKGLQVGYVQTLGKSKNAKIKNISKEINRMIDQYDPNLTNQESIQIFSRIQDYVNQSFNELTNLEKREALQLIPNASKKPITKTVEKILLGDEIVDKSNPMEDNLPSQKEHNDRIIQAGEDIFNGNEPLISDETINKIDYSKNFDSEKVLREQRLDPDSITVDAETFQFKQVDYDPKTGVSTKLKGVDVWDQDSAEVVLVYQKADGTYVIADGHQRLALAKKIKAEGKQQPYMLSNIYREVDGYTPQQIMVKAMIKNVRTGTANSTDVAKILRQSNKFIFDFTGSISPRSKRWINAVDLSKLNSEAFGYFLNNGVNEDIAALVGRIVEDPELQVQVMDYLAKGKFDNLRQMEIAARDLINQGVVEGKIEDLFGTQTIKELLIKERSLVLDKALKEISKDKKIAKFLVNQEGDIISKGKNKLDTETNKKIAQESAILYEAIIKTANVKGEISEELTKAAKLYKAGNQQQAVRTFKDAITEAIREGNIVRDSRVGTERNPFLEGYNQNETKKPKPTEEQTNLEDSVDPYDGDFQYTKQLSSVQEGIEDPKIFGSIDDNFDVLSKTNEDGTIVMEKMSDIRKDIQQDQQAIDFLKDCKGLK